MEFDLNLEQWAEIESDDMFQNEKYCGGFDYDDAGGEFWFRLFEGDDEYWFSLTLDEVQAGLAGDKNSIDVEPADKIGD